MNTQTFLTNNTFDTIYHIADLHIRLHHRHDEYKEVFARLHDSLANSQSDNALLVIAGDVLHAYNDLSPELIEVMMDMLERLSSLMPIILIAGNHDANLGNMNRTDGLTPFNNMGLYKNLYYLKNTGYYTFGNVTFVVNSLLDKEPWIDGKNNTNTINIGLFHGALYQAQTPTGYAIEDKHVNTSSFDGCDLVMLGDIHHYQQVGSRPIVYSGSLIQQNFGETPWNHGYVKWDLPSKAYEHVEIPNDFGYCTFIIENGELPDICEFCKKHPEHRDKHCQTSLYIPLKPRLRIGTINTQPSVYESIINDLRKKYEIQSIVRLPIKNTKRTNDTVATKEKITDIKFQNELIAKYLQRHKEITANDITQIQKINEGYNSDNQDLTLSAGSEWSPIFMEWSNLFCYGESNWINFSDWQGWVGFIQPNRIGKTSIWDIMLFCIFDTTTRGKVSRVQRSGSEFYEYRFRFSWNNQIYEVSQRGGTKKRSKSLMKIDHDGNMIPEDKCREKLKQMFGDIKSLLSTTFRLQKSPDTYFLNKTEKERKRFLSGLLNLDLLNNLFEKAKKAHRDSTTELRVLESELKHCTSGQDIEQVKVEHKEQVQSERKMKKIYKE